MNSLRQMVRTHLRFSLTALLLMVTLVALTLGSIQAWRAYQRRAQLASVFGGERGLGILTKPDKVEAYRLELQTEPVISKELKDYPILTGPIGISTSDLAKLQAVLANWSSYAWNNAKACLPQYGVRIDFTRGADRLSVLLCFECDQLSTWMNGDLAGGGDFDRSRAQLVRIVKALFPNDAEIQSLQE